MSYDDDDDFPTNPEAVRKATLAGFRKQAKEAFAAHPHVNSIVIAVSQYWADEADDAVHCDVYSSARAVPLWPHNCEYGDSPTEGEGCSNCATDRIDCYPEEWDDNGASIGAFETYCHESGSQEEPGWQNELPYAIARRAGDDVVVEVVGELQRSVSLDDDDAEAVEPDATWQDARARELLFQVAATPDDDGPRRVLADYLMEHENPRGEYIALALDARDLARRDELLEEHEARWLGELRNAVMLSTVQWSRGFPVAATLAGSEGSRSASPVWSTFERLTIHGACILDPAMRALRELGAANGDWIDALVAAKQPWAIEKLTVDDNNPNVYEALARATNLPALRELVVISSAPDAIVAALPHATWWSRLQRLSVLTNEADLATWQPRRHELTVPWFGIGQLHHDPVRAPGWEFAFDRKATCEVTLRGFTPQASFEELRPLLREVQAQTIRLVPSRYYAPTAADVERLADARVTV